MFPGLIGDGQPAQHRGHPERRGHRRDHRPCSVLLYAGLGWLSALRDALITVFELPAREQPNFVMGKVRDLVTLDILGAVLLFAVAFTGIVSGFSEDCSTGSG